MRWLPDDFDTFGEYAVIELRSLSSEMYRKMVKKEICQSIARIAELDDLNSLATCSTKITEAPSPDSWPDWNQYLCQQLIKII
jgi:hypothetical protein